MQELAPGLFDWTARHEGHGMIVHSHYVAAGGVAIDPMGAPEGGLPGPVELVVLTSRHHLRHAAGYGAPIVCHEAGLHEFDGADVEVRGYAFGDELAPGLRALEVGVLTPEETALLIDLHGGGWLALADAVMRHAGGALGFVPDHLLGDDPEAIKAGLHRSLRGILDEHDFTGLLLAHGAPGTRAELDDFVAASA